MTEKLSRWASIAEIVASVVVVISVVFLAMEIQENTNTLKRSSYDDIVESIIDWRQDIVTSPDLAEAMVKVRNGVPLTEVEESRLRLSTISIYQHYERAFWAKEYDQMGQSEWRRFDRSICNPGGRWDEEMAKYFTDEFVEFISRCGAADATAPE